MSTRLPDSAQQEVFFVDGTPPHIRLPDDPDERIRSADVHIREELYNTLPLREATQKFSIQTPTACNENSAATIASLGRVKARIQIIREASLRMQHPDVYFPMIVRLIKEITNAQYAAIWTLCGEGHVDIAYDTLDIDTDLSFSNQLRMQYIEGVFRSKTSELLVPCACDNAIAQEHSILSPPGEDVHRTGGSEGDDESIDNYVDAATSIVPILLPDRHEAVAVLEVLFRKDGLSTERGLRGLGGKYAEIENLARKTIPPFFMRQNAAKKH